MADVESKQRTAEKTREEYQAVRRAFEAFADSEIGSAHERVTAQRLVDSLAPYLARATSPVVTDLDASNDAVAVASKALFAALRKFNEEGESSAARELGQRAVAAVVRAMRLDGWPRVYAPSSVDSPLSFGPPTTEDYKREAWKLAHAALDDPDNVHRWVLKARVLLVQLANPDLTEAPFGNAVDAVPHCETCGAVALHWEILKGKTACVHCMKRELDRVQAALDTEMACVSGLRDEVRRAEHRASTFESALRGCPTACPIRHRPGEYGLDDHGGRYSVRVGAPDVIHHAVDASRPVPDCVRGTSGAPQGSFHVQTLWRGVTCPACLAMRVVEGSKEQVADVVLTTVPDDGSLKVEQIKSRSCAHNSVEFWDLGEKAPARGPLEWCKRCGAIRYVVAGGEWCAWRHPSPSTEQVPVAIWRQHLVRIGELVLRLKEATQSPPTAVIEISSPYLTALAQALVVDGGAERVVGWLCRKHREDLDKVVAVIRTVPAKEWPT